MTVEQYSLARSGFEVYKTSEPDSETLETTIGGKNSEGDSSEDNSSKDGFKLLNGETIETDYYANMFKNSFEGDYEDISSSGNVSFPSVDKSKVYKGKKVCLKKEWETSKKPITWKDLKTVLLGFITEQTYSQDNVELKIVGMHKLMEREAQFDFHQMKRSEIIQAIIEESGLKAEVDPTGLKDDVIDYSNQSSDSSDSSDAAIGESSGNIAQLAKKVCKGKKTDEAKAQAIHTYIRDHVQYPSPNYYDHHKCPTEVLSSGYSNCCDRARLGHEMANAVGLVNRGVLGPGHVWVQYKINGKWVDSDPGVSRPKIGAVWQNMSMNSVWEFPSCK